MIELNALSYTYPEQTAPALQQIDLRVAAGEFVLLAGASGSGKSTLLRCLNGLVPHFSGGRLQGSVWVNGLDVVAAGPQHMSQHVGFVFQNPEAQAVLDRVEPEIAFGLESSPEFRPSGRESRAVREQQQQLMRERVGEALGWLGLTEYRQRPLRTLSGGERQKVALACALARRPALLVLDEPTSQLDPVAAADLLARLVWLNREQGYTILLAEHRLERVLSFVDRVLYLENGRLQLDAPPREAVRQLPVVPPVVALGQQRGWEPLPLTVAEAQAYLGGAETEIETEAEAEAEIEGEPVMKVAGVSFAYGATPILQDVSFTVGRGELVALLGHNGAGKTTLLQCLVGLLTATAGMVMINGRSTSGRSVADICQEIAYLPQNPDDLLFADSVVEELAITLGNHGRPVDQKLMRRLLTQLGIAELAHAYPRDLSIGQRQRVALGAVTITEPDLIVLDEPTRGLDVAAKQGLATLWRQWQAQGKGVLLVTHDVELVARVARRVVILEKGRVAGMGKTAVVLPQFPAFAPQLSHLFPAPDWQTINEQVLATGG